MAAIIKYKNSNKTDVVSFDNLRLKGSDGYYYKFRKEDLSDINYGRYRIKKSAECTKNCKKGHQCYQYLKISISKVGGKNFVFS